MRKPGKKVIATDSLSTLIAASDKKDTKNPKTQIIRKLLEQEGGKITLLLWVPSQVEISRNKEVDYAAKESLDENLEKTEEYTPQDLVNWMTQQHEEQQQRKWEQTDSEMRNRKQQKTTRKKEKRHQRDDTKRQGSDQPITDRLFQSQNATQNSLPTIS
jgi:hypothetical protein